MDRVSDSKHQPPTGVIVCDHGSRRAQSNDTLKAVARAFAERFAVLNGRPAIVEPAHMELAMPDLAAAYAACVARGAEYVVVLPFFLARGRHWTRDIPSLVNQAAVQHPGTTYSIAEPLGPDDLLLDLLKKRLDANDQPTIAAGQPDPRLADVEPTQRRTQCSVCPFAADPETGEITLKAKASPEVA
ncbi:MAG: CbiX/SirB N-terminal domain-containing protein [Planctomycetota bacterium]